jgi:hypothetical protein
MERDHMIASQAGLIGEPFVRLFRWRRIYRLADAQLSCISDEIEEII